MAVRSTIGTAICTIIFGISALIRPLEMAAYASSLGIALCYLTVTVANESFSPSIYARLATMFASVYCAMVCIVYYTQLTFVRLASPSPEALSVVAYPPGTAFFAIDIFGYFIMSISYIWLGLSIRNDRTLQKMLIGMGIWGSSCIVCPFLPFFYDKSEKASSDQYGMMSLALWAILFSPIMLMLAKYYRTQDVISEKVD